MDNQHQKITGYRDLSQAEIDLMNEVETLGVTLGDLVERVRGTADVDQRWASIAQTDLQKGLMALVRAVARPDTF